MGNYRWSKPYRWVRIDIPSKVRWVICRDCQAILEGSGLGIGAHSRACLLTKQEPHLIGRGARIAASIQRMAQALA